jgi:hypothetical protein
MMPLILALLASSAPTAQSSPPAKWGGALEVGAALMSPSAQVTLEGHYRLERVGFLLRVEWNPWLSVQQGPTPGALNAALGLELRSFQGRLRSALSVGASVLLFRSALDEVGSVGLYVGVAPATILFPLSARVSIRVDPLSLHVVAPSLRTIPLIVLQYRHTVGVELTW